MYGAFQENLSKKLPPLHFFAAENKTQERLLAKSIYTFKCSPLRKLPQSYSLFTSFSSFFTPFLNKCFSILCAESF